MRKIPQKSTPEPLDSNSLVVQYNEYAVQRTYFHFLKDKKILFLGKFFAYLILVISDL